MLGEIVEAMGRAHEEPRHGFQARSPHPQRLRHGRRLPLRSDGEWSKTSVSMRPETRRRLKTYAAAHDMRIQEVIDLALEAYLA